MKYTQLSINSQKSQESFEYVRWHIINYILISKGNVIARSPIAQGRTRPPVNEGEFGVVAFQGVNEGFYSFYIEPQERGKDRQLQIVIGCTNKEELEKRVSEIIECNQHLSNKLKREEIVIKTLE